MAVVALGAAASFVALQIGIAAITAEGFPAPAHVALLRAAVVLAGGLVQTLLVVGVWPLRRFSAERAAGRPRYAYFPFGGGPRMCIGNIFALTEAQLVLATVARRYRLKLAANHPVELQPLITLRPLHGVKVVLEQRGN